MATDKSQKAFSQKQKVLEHLKQYRTITSLEAITHYGCTRLASRINDLRNEGHHITTKNVVESDGTHYGIYTLVKAAKTTRTK